MGVPRKSTVGRLSEVTCYDMGVQYVAWGGESTGGEESTPSESCQYLTVAKGTTKSIVTYEMRYWLPRGAGTACPGGACHTTVSILLSSEGEPGTLHSHSETITPLGMAGWTCYAEPSQNRPNAQTCFKRISEVLDVEWIAAADYATLSVYTLASTAGSSTDSTFGLMYAVGELVGLRSAAFDYQAGTEDGIDGLRIDETVEIVKPEWEAVTRENAATEDAYTAETISPAAFVVNKKLKVKAKFWGSDAWESALMKARTQLPGGAASPYGDLGQMAVTFDEYGESDEVVFESAVASDKVGANDITLKWEIVSITVRPNDYHEQPYQLAVPSYESRRTTHRIYTVYKAPVAPMVEPWAKVLELSSAMLAPLESTATDETRVREIADAIFYSKWTGYTTRFFKPSKGYLYNPGGTCSCGSTTEQYLNLTHVLNELGSVGGGQANLQCNDSSNFHAILAASQGITALPTYIRDTRPAPPGPPPLPPWRLLAPTALYRGAGGTDSCRIDEFLFHQVASLSSLYDTSARAATGTTSTCTPSANFYGLNESTYLATVFPTQALAYTNFTRPAVGIAACPVQ